MEVVFLGTPQFAVPTLKRLVDAGHQVSAVFTQPDRPKGRGGQLATSAVKDAALRLGIPVHQPERIRRPESVEQLRGMRPDAMVVVGYGQIIPQSIIDIPTLGIINVHGSLLPKYRGAAPIQWAVANGETITGVTTMRIDAGLDTGDMLLKWSTPIGPEESALELGPRLAEAGANLLLQTLRGLEDSSIAPEPQDANQATLAPILKKEAGLIDWSMRAEAIFNRSRGLLPWPGTYTSFRGQMLHIWKSRVFSDAVNSATPGRAYALHRRLLADCGADSTLELLELQIEGRKRMTAEAFLNGQHLVENEIFGEKKN